MLLAVSLYMSGHYLDEQERLVAAGDVEGATQKLDMAARLDPFSPQPLLRKSFFLQRQGNYEEAAGILREAIRRDPRNEVTHVLLASLQVSRLNDYAAAEKTYRELLEVSPNLVLARNGLAQALLRQGDLEGAKRQYEKLVESGQISTQGLHYLGRIYVRTGEPEKGVTTLRRARQRATAELENLNASEREQGREFVESIDLAIADALVVQGRYAEARRVVAESSAEQAPAILELLETDPERYRESVVDSEIY